MIILNVYTCMGELHVTARTTLGAVRVAGRLEFPPALHGRAYDFDESAAPESLVQAICQMVDEIEHDTMGGLAKHLMA